MDMSNYPILIIILIAVFYFLGKRYKTLPKQPPLFLYHYDVRICTIRGFGGQRGYFITDKGVKYSYYRCRGWYDKIWDDEKTSFILKDELYSFLSLKRTVELRLEIDKDKILSMKNGILNSKFKMLGIRTDTGIESMAILFFDQEKKHYIRVLLSCNGGAIGQLQSDLVPQIYSAFKESGAFKVYG